MMRRCLCPKCSVRRRARCAVCAARCLGSVSPVRSRRGPDLMQPMAWPLAVFRRASGKGEPALLSMHELTALMLLQRSPNRCELDGADLRSLSLRKLVTFETLPGGKRRPRITRDGADWLAAVMRGR